jgi:hypothetical protein
MPRRSRSAIMFAAGVSVVAASMPARGQTGFLPGDLTTGLARPNAIAPPPGFLEPGRDLSPPPFSWSAVPAPGTRGSPGIITQRQAMGILDAAGFTYINPPEPALEGSWTTYARTRVGTLVRATVDSRGNISTSR